MVPKVAGTGVSNAPEHLRLVFERFCLAVVKQFVEAHGGTVSVASAPGEGTTFRRTLPSCAPVPQSAWPPLTRG
jgi:signal transduction histidine kinase